MDASLVFTVIRFVMEQENLDFPDAVRFLAKRAGMEVPTDDGYESTYKRKERLWALFFTFRAA